MATRRDEESKLTDNQKDSPSLWNTSLPAYKDDSKKVEETQTLSLRFNVSVAELKKLLHSLRTSMTREVKRVQADSSYVSRWKFYKDLEFLRSEIIKSLDGKKEKEWNDGHIDTLIDFYQENELWWNHTLQDYKDRNLKAAALSKLADILVIHSLDEIKAQRHTLTTTFDREHKRVEGSKRMGSGIDSVYKSGWTYYERMLFMSQSTEVDESVSTINVFTDLEDYTVSRCSKNRKQEKCKRKREIEVSDVKVELIKEAINVLKSPVGSSVEEDKSPVNKEISAFGKLVQETLTRFNDQ